MMYSKSKQSIEQICVCRIDEIIKFLTIIECIRIAALRSGQREPMGQRVAGQRHQKQTQEGGVYGCPEWPNECPDRPKI
nr:MAG TPA: hypothetical protein [Caudoviricetes sp.]